MEIGAVKQAFNNELILLKKKLNQAKTQIIHKLTRKAKQLTEKKAPNALQEKFKKKAENAVKEVLILKKIKARDIGRFIVTHSGKLQDYLNKPQIDNDKACARILLHKAMQEKYKFIRNRFSNIPIKDLFMSRNERLKLKKEEKLKKKEKRDRKKAKNNVVNAEGDWDVEDVEIKTGKALKSKVDVKKYEEKNSGDEQYLSDKEEEEANSEQSESNENVESGEDQEPQSEQSEPGSDDEGSIEDGSGEGFKIRFKGQSDDESEEENSSNEMEAGADQELSEDEAADVGKLVKLTPSKSVRKTEKAKVKKSIVKNKANDTELVENAFESIKKGTRMEQIESKIKPEKKTSKSKQDKKQKDSNRNKNLQDKILHKKFKKDLDDAYDVEQKVVDPFFVTATGENYMSIVEPRQPDEVKEEHKQGNRKLRRAVMFGHVPKIKPRQEFRQENNRYDRQDSFGKRPGNRFDQQNGSARNNSKFNNKDDNNRFNNRFNDNKKPRFNDTRNNRRIEEDSKPEKLHPSWEAKKKQSGILPFQGKKIVFDES